MKPLFGGFVNARNDIFLGVVKKILGGGYKKIAII